MAGYPDYFEVSELEIVAAGGAAGDDKQDLIEIGPSADPQRMGFKLIVTFEGPNTHVAPHFSTLGFAEGSSDGGPTIPVTADFWAESIGPATAEVHIGSDTVNLTAGGDPGGHPMADHSLYRVEVNVANAGDIFVDPVDLTTLQPGLYRIGCAVNFNWDHFGTHEYFDAYFDGDLVVRVVERGP